MEINVQGVNITLTDDQLQQIDRQVKKKTLKVTDRIKSYEDACEDQGINPEESRPFKSPVNNLQERANAHWELMVVCASLNEGKEAEIKKFWQPYFNFSDGKIVSFRAAGWFVWFGVYCFASVGLSVHSEELAIYLGKQFLSTYQRMNKL